MCSIHTRRCSKARMTFLWFAWVQPINVVKDDITMEWHDFIPVPASSSCGRRHEENRQWRPTACCVPETAGCLCMGPDKKNCVTHTTSDWMESNSDLLCEFYLNVFSESVKYLFCHCHGLGEVLFPWFVNDILARVIPIEITDRLLDLKKMGKVIIKSLFWMCNRHTVQCAWPSGERLMAAFW